MQLIRVTEDQFESTGARTLKHVPTGGHYATYNYQRLPPDIAVITSYQRDRDADGNEYSPEEIENAARYLLVRKLRDAGIMP